MIRSFANQLTKDIFEGINSTHSRKFPPELHRKARVKLSQIDFATSLSDLRVPPSNRLEALKGNLKDFYSIRINDQWRIIFQWSEQSAIQVEIIDYH